MEEETQKKISKKDLLDSIEQLLNSYENLPPDAMIMPVSNYDMQSVLLLIKSLIKSDIE